MTEEQLSRLEKLEAEASAGPWENVNTGPLWSVIAGTQPVADLYRGWDKLPNKVLADAEFIAEMRNALPELLREIRRLDHLHDLDHSLADQWQAKNEALEAELEGLEDCRCCDNGYWWSECCDGSGGCTCRGEPINMGVCNVCGGMGEHPKQADLAANRKTIEGYGFLGTGPNDGSFNALPRMGLEP